MLIMKIDKKRFIRLTNKCLYKDCLSISFKWNDCLSFPSFKWNEWNIQHRQHDRIIPNESHLLFIQSTMFTLIISIHFRMWYGAYICRKFFFDKQNTNKMKTISFTNSNLIRTNQQKKHLFTFKLLSILVCSNSICFSLPFCVYFFGDIVWKGNVYICIHIVPNFF